jgi:hypothetical protein
VPGQGKRRRRQEAERQRTAARTAPDAGRWEVIFETHDHTELCTQLRRLREGGVDAAMIRIDAPCTRAAGLAAYLVSRFVTDDAQGAECDCRR